SIPIWLRGPAVTTQPITTPRLRGEVGSRARCGCRVRGKLPVPPLAAVLSPKCPSPRPSPRKRGEGISRGSVRASLRLLHLARTRTGRIGLLARRAGLGHQAVQRLCFAVEHRARLLAAQHDAPERVHEHLVELAIALP